MRDAGDHYAVAVIIDLVEDPVVADPHTEEPFRVGQALGSGWSGLLAENQDLGINTRKNFRRKAFEVSLSSARDLDPIRGSTRHLWEAQPSPHLVVGKSFVRLRERPSGELRIDGILCVRPRLSRSGLL